MAYTIKTSRQFEKDFSRPDSLMQNKVLIALEQLSRSPFAKAKKLKNTDVGIFRIRTGDYRVRFDVIQKDIYLYRVRHRKDLYKK